MKHLFISLVLIAPLFFTGCKTTESSTRDFIIAAVPYIESGSCLAATIALDYAVSDSDRLVKAKCLYGLAKGLRTLMSGEIPTAEELQTTLESFAINDGQVWCNLAQSLSNIYAKEVAKINGDPKLAMEIIEAIAHGIETASEPYAKDM